MIADTDLGGAVAVVTGASSGIGRAMAEALAAGGARVVLVARRRERLEAITEALNAAGAGRAAAVTADLADCSGLEAVARETAAPFGAPRILVNAAGVNLRQPVDEVSLDDWRLTLDLHLTAPFFLARALVPAMREGGWGRIINLASLQSLRAFPDSLPYGTAKGGVVQMTRAMAQAWSRHGIGCNAIAPGFFPTELTAPVFEDAERAAALAAHTPAGRNGRLEDLAGVTRFLASHASDYITGQTLFVDGGFSSC